MGLKLAMGLSKLFVPSQTVQLLLWALLALILLWAARMIYNAPKVRPPQLKRFEDAHRRRLAEQHLLNERQETLRRRQRERSPQPQSGIV